MKNQKTITIAVGAFVFCALIGLFFLGFKASSLGSFRPQNVYQIRANFGDVSGLSKNAQVSLAGVQIGRVGEIRLNLARNEAEVLLNIDGAARLPVDSAAQILTSGLLGERYIGISLGSSSETLKDGDTLRRTGGALVLEKALQQFMGGKGGFYPEKSYHVTARFSDVSGLNLDAPVTQSGVQIGRVSAIRLEQQSFQVIVEMEIAAEYGHIPFDSSADIVSSSLLGGKYVAISVGGDSQVLTDGDEFQFSNSSMVLERVIQQFISNMTMQQ